MALTECPKCGGIMDHEAEECPQCAHRSTLKEGRGFDINKEIGGWILLFAILIIGYFILSSTVYRSCFYPSDGGDGSQASTKKNKGEDKLIWAARDIVEEFLRNWDSTIAVSFYSTVQLEKKGNKYLYKVMAQWIRPLKDQYYTAETYLVIFETDPGNPRGYSYYPGVARLASNDMPTPDAIQRAKILNNW